MQAGAAHGSRARVSRVVESAGRQSPLETYRGRADELRRSAEETGLRHQSATRGLLLVGLLATVAMYQAWSVRSLPRWAPLPLIPVAGYLFRKMARTQRQAREIRCLEEYYRRGIDRLTLRWDSLDEGLDFQDAGHFYATDLDLFGRGSLFQLLCAARTHAGRETLARWMKAPADRDEALARRAAMSELTGRQDLRERLAAAGKSMVSDCRPETFQRWLAESSSPFPGWAPLAAFVLAAVALLVPLLYFTQAMVLENIWWMAAAVGLSEILLVRFLAERVGLVMQSVRLPSGRIADSLRIAEDRREGALLVAEIGGDGGPLGPRRRQCIAAHAAVMAPGPMARPAG